jgi:hypothetical protein
LDSWIPLGVLSFLQLVFLAISFSLKNAHRIAV